MCFALSINEPLPFAARGGHIDTRVAEPLGDQKGTAVAMLLSGFRLHVAAQAPATLISLRHLCGDLLSTDRGCGPWDRCDAEASGHTQRHVCGERQGGQRALPLPCH